MGIITRRVDISAPPERVWSVLIDIERWHEWTESIDRIEKLDPGALTVGQRARIAQPKLAAAIWTVTAIEPGRRFTWTTRRPGFEGIGDHLVEPTGTGSRVTNTLEMRGLLSGLVMRLYGAQTERYVDLETSGLKARSENPEFRHNKTRP